MTKKKSNILVFSILTVVLIVVLIVTLVVTMIIVPTNRYNEAVALKNSGKIDDAYRIFSDLGSFKDCDKIKEQLEQDCPPIKFLLSSPGDIVSLGKYEQDNNLSNGKEPIEWIVLHNENGDIYLLSKYVLDVQQFNTTNTKECSLDDWLKTTFSEIAFESIDNDIITRVGILRETDIVNYGMTREQTTADYTKYALDQDPERGYASGLMWWLTEDELFNGGDHINAPVVLEDGSHGKYGTDVTDRCGVRPAMWLFANSDNIPEEPVFDGSAPTYYRSSGGSSSKCDSCGGTGKKSVTWYSEGDWGEKSYSNYDCTACGGDGRK